MRLPPEHINLLMLKVNKEEITVLAVVMIGTDYQGKVGCYFPMGLNRNIMNARNPLEYHFILS